MKIIAKCWSPKRWLTTQWIVLAMVSATAPVRYAGALSSGACIKVRIEAEVNAGKEWSVPLGQGWVFRVMPIQPANAGYSGWDLVVDRDPPAGFPELASWGRISQHYSRSSSAQKEGASL